jgi:thiamine biosynthesis protein ThiS
MQITLNGNTREVEDGMTLAALVAQLALKTDRIAAERNLALVPRAQYAATVLADGDKLEIVTFVGGG